MNPPHSRTVARRLVAVLFVAQCLSSAALIANVQVNPIMSARLGGSDSLAGVAGTLLLIGAAISAHFSGRFMQRHGRRLGLSLGFLVGTVGMLLSGVGVALGSFAIFLVGVALLGGARGAADQSRYAAADTQPHAHRARAISTVVFAGTIGAVAGPWLASSRGNLLGRLSGFPQSGTMWAGVLLFALAGALIFLLLRPDPQDLGRQIAGEPAEPQPSAADLVARPLGQILRLPAAQLALASMVIGQATMVLVMSVTSLHMDHNHHGGDEISLVFMAHTIGMYALSMVNGAVIDRLGRKAAIWIGVALLIAGSLIAAAAQETLGLALALFLVGLGWNLCFVAGSALLSDLLGLAERSRIQGSVELVINLTSAACTILSGVILDYLGYAALGEISAVLALVPLLVLAAHWLRPARDASTAQAG